MSSHGIPRALTFKAGATGIVKGCAVKGGADNKHVVVGAGNTDKLVGIALGAALLAEDKVEVALTGGGAKGLAGGTIAFGDLLTSDASGNLITTANAGDRVVAVAMESAVAGDLFSVEVNVCAV